MLLLEGGGEKKCHPSLWIISVFLLDLSKSIAIIFSLLLFTYFAKVAAIFSAWSTSEISKYFSNIAPTWINLRVRSFRSFSFSLFSTWGTVPKMRIYNDKKFWEEKILNLTTIRVLRQVIWDTIKPYFPYYWLYPNRVWFIGTIPITIDMSGFIFFPTEDPHFKEREGRSPVSKWEMNVGRR